MKPFPVMADMKLTPEETASDTSIPCCSVSEANGPTYPWGLRITLTEKELEKLGISHEAATVGGMFHLHAMARITSVSEEDRADGLTCRVEAQIESMAVESEDAENEEMDQAEDGDESKTPSRARRLYRR